MACSTAAFGVKIAGGAGEAKARERRNLISSTAG
jgi:hypothetical protein